ncbi:MAG TPA: YciI family protein [Gemmataceae bacterium]|jgi:uncharacterized protein YciI|nr:YciI family protein [Gemmataceae bacterium]
MKFAAVIAYSQDKAKVDAFRPVHRQYLTKLRDEGKLAISGPFMDNYGALIVYEAETAELAESYLKGDPFHANGIFLQWQIRPWNVVIGNPALLPS